MIIESRLDKNKRMKLVKELDKYTTRYIVKFIYDDMGTRVTSQTVRNWRSGRTRPYSIYMVSLANLTGFTIEELLNESID